ncbi:MAG: hypothetical protein IPM82_23280 [Saprospiraceae bacterium]|nr:hypothetical protein [Saprospiraceae bacterium]
MKYFLPCESFHYFRLNIFLLLILVATHVNAQVPQGIPNDSSKIKIDSPFDIVVYIVLPGLMVGYYFWWRKKYKK